MSDKITPVKDLATTGMPPRTEVQVAMINAAAKIAAAKVAVIGDEYNRNHDFFKTEFERISQTIEQKGW